ncbi:2-oxoglutarate dehydrogenase complex dihydrolipoyllysine-residue succinyltransferase [Endothiovibrio diazotrophicus]
MTIEIKLNHLPESVSEGLVAAWRRAPGERVYRDDPLVDIETDKVVLEIPAPADGVLGQILKPEGETVRADDTIALLEPAGSSAVPGPAAPGEAEDSAPPMSPAVRHLLAEHRLDPQTIEGSGRDGRILKGDVLDHLKRRDATPPEPAASTEPPTAPETVTTVAPAAPAAPTAPPVAATGGRRAIRRVAMTPVRKRIAERLLESQRQTATLTTFNEFDMSAVKRLRAEHGERFLAAHGVKLGFMSFFVKAVTEALVRHPIVNAGIDGDDILYHDYYDIGVAVGSPRGLVVPVLRDTERLDFAGVEKSIADLAARAQEGRLALEELSGGTFSITNGGVFGSLLSTPILNPPQSAILGLHKLEERPVAVAGEVVIRPMMYAALSYDHRLIDGRDAVLFLTTIKALIEDPARLLLAV